MQPDLNDEWDKVHKQSASYGKDFIYTGQMFDWVENKTSFSIYGLASMHTIAMNWWSNSH